jgi:hypothetical protein
MQTANYRHNALISSALWLVAATVHHTELQKRQMKKSHILFVTSLTYLLLPITMHAQYVYHITRPWMVDGFGYNFEAIDCDGDVCFVTAEKLEFDQEFVIQKGTPVFFRSLDGGRTWTEQSSGLPTMPSAFPYHLDRLQVLDSFHIVCLGMLANSGDGTIQRLFIHSTNGGASWLSNLDSENVPYYYSSSLHFSTSSTGIITFDSSVFTTLDGSDHWVRASLNSNYLAAGCSYRDGRFAAFPWYDGLIYTTTDDWKHIDSSKHVTRPGGGNYYYYGFKGEDTIVALRPYYIGQNWGYLGISRSLDAGQTFEQVTLPDSILAGNLRMSRLETDPVCIGGLGGGGFRHVLVNSRDHGMTWSFDSVVAGDTLYPYQQFEIRSAAATKKGEVAGIIAPSGSYGAASYLARLTPTQNRVTNKEPAPANINTYPNPASSVLHVGEAFAAPRVFDALGRAYDLECRNGTLDVSQLPAGVYYLGSERAEGRSHGAGTLHARFVKE